jgi:hypothetical protein
MSREDLSWILLVLVLLVVSYLIGQQVLGPERTTKPVDLSADVKAEQSPFRIWFWEERGLDIAAQVGLLFVGTLGMAALLPHSGEGPTE